MINPEFVKKVKSAHNIVEVISESVVLRKSGNQQWVGLCPFHSEKTPSFSVSESKQLFHCYGCKKGGDLIHFVMEMGALSFSQALGELALKAGVPFTSQGPTSEVSQEKDLGWRLNQFAMREFQKFLKSSKRAWDYLERRGVDRERVESFYLGYAPDSWTGLTDQLVKKKAPLPVAKKLGLVREGKMGLNDFFRDRLIFPIVDMRGKVLGFGGRDIEAKENSPKYLNSSDSQWFHKAVAFFGLFQAQKHIRASRTAIVVEGYFDVLALHSAGHENAIAACGTALGTEHIQILRKLADKIIVLFDGDRAGKQATEKAMITGLQSGVALFGAELPEGLDPDELLVTAEGKSKIGEILESAEPILDKKIRQAVEYSKKGAEEKTRALKLCAAWLKEFHDPIGRNVRVEGLIQALGLSRTLAKGVFGDKGGRRPPLLQEVVVQAPRAAPVNPTKTDLLLLKAWARDFEKIDRQLEKFTTFEELFTSPSLREVIAWWRVVRSSGHTKEDALAWPPEVENNLNIKSIFLPLLMESDSVEAPLDASSLEALLIVKVREYWARISHEIGERMRVASIAQDVVMTERFQKDYLDLQRRMKELKEFL